MTSSDLSARRAIGIVRLGWASVKRALTTPCLRDVQNASASDRGNSRSLCRYSLLAGAAVVIVGAALMPSAGLVANADAAHSAPPAANRASQNPPANPEAANSGLAASPVGDADEDCCGDDHMWSWGNGWWWLVMPIGMIIFWGGIIALIVWAIRRFTGGRGGGGHAIDIARTRYAKGEISREEFERLRRDLA